MSETNGMTDLTNLLDYLNKRLSNAVICNKDKFCFSLVTDGIDFYGFNVEELEESGWSFCIFSSEDCFDADLEEAYEDEDITWVEAAYQQINRNLHKMYYEVGNLYVGLQLSETDNEEKGED